MLALVKKRRDYLDKQNLFLNLPSEHANVQLACEDSQSSPSNASALTVFCCIQEEPFQLDQKILSDHNLPQLILN